MQRWHKQVLIDTAKAAIPGKQYIRQALRRVRPYMTNAGNDIQLFENSIRQIERLRDAGHDVRGKRILEIGSGWHPITAMTFLAVGAAGVTLTDTEWLLDASLIRSASEFVCERQDYIIEKLGHADIDRIQVKEGTVPEMMNRLNLTYLVPYRTEMSASGSVDIVISISVFEHIPAKVLELMISDFRRVLAPGGAMVHFIDCSDHYSHRDRSISRCNFLQYEEWQWRLLSLNPQSYHNRLRHSDFMAMIRLHGFKIAFVDRVCRESEQREVAAMRLASRFVGRDIEDLATIGTALVAVAP